MRLIALIVLLIPVFLAGVGIKWMRDVVFAVQVNPFPNFTLQFIAGLLLFVLGMGFIGGFIFHRDRKNGKLAPRFQNKKEATND
ncbi:DUF2627 domain-containing protein [Geomicrobium sp. JCM 19039]|uniref:DUF2627 domain-containing protein n=1 Tax=Geomicrobium sp. JCM 19039 TaxID=1460636 RepID=UPI00045F43E2|nr:DUF2627 domain-containing protein [Geomicrobium sp. JCM 19039]GAK12816.1 hypothetical protein JCM19039_2617 [Geomicrobium sp. JCM 19039]